MKNISKPDLLEIAADSPVFRNYLVDEWLNNSAKPNWKIECELIEYVRCFNYTNSKIAAIRFVKTFAKNNNITELNSLTEAKQFVEKHVVFQF